MKNFLNSFLADANNSIVSVGDSVGIRSFFGGFNSVTPANAQRLINVFGCVNIKANALSIIPIKLYKREGKGKVEARENPLYRLLRYAPNPNLTASEWKKMLSQDLDLRGNHYCQIIWNYKGEIKSIYPLKADSMTVTWGQNREKVYTYNGKAVSSNQILHIMDIPDSEGLKGLTRIEVARETLEFAHNTSKHGNRVFKNGAAPSGVFTHKSTLTDDAYQRLKNDLEDRYTGVGNAGKTMLLEEDMQFKPIEMKNTDAQWIESKKLNREEIATLFGVPVSMLNDATNVAYGNLEQKSQEFYNNTILPIIVLCEERFYLKFLTTQKQQKELAIKFNYNSLLRAETKTRTEYYKTMHSIAALNSNEVRELEDMNTYEGGDNYFMQLSYDTPQNIAEGQTDE